MAEDRAETRFIESSQTRGLIPLGTRERSVHILFSQLHDIATCRLGKEAAPLFAQPVTRPSDPTIGWRTTTDGARCSITTISDLRSDAWAEDAYLTALVGNAWAIA